MWNYFDNFTPFFHSLQSHLVPSFMFVRRYMSTHSSYSGGKRGKFSICYCCLLDAWVYECFRLCTSRSAIIVKEKRNSEFLQCTKLPYFHTAFLHTRNVKSLYHSTLELFVSYADYYSVHILHWKSNAVLIHETVNITTLYCNHSWMSQ